MEEKKSRYSEKQNKWTQAYLKNNMESISFRVRKGEKQKYVNAAATAGQSMAQFFLSAADEKIEREANR